MPAWVMRAGRRAGVFAATAAAMFAALLGLRIVPSEAGLGIAARPLLLGGVILLAAILGAASAWRRTSAAGTHDRRASGHGGLDAGRAGIVLREVLGDARLLPAALLILALALPLFGGRYVIDTGTIVLIYAMLAFGLNIVVGQAGLLDLGYVAFYAVGAYTYALLSTVWGLGFWTCLPLCGALAALFGIALGFPVLRLRGDYLAVVTLGFGEIIRIVLNNFASLTNGPRGISDIPRPTLFGYALSGNGPQSLGHLLGLHATPMWRVVFLYYLALGLAVLTVGFTARLRRTPLGRAFEALREDEIAARALGLGVTSIKLAAFASGAAFAGFAGCFFAARAAFVSPESFTFMESATVLAIVVLGGLGSQLGTAMAAIVMIGGAEWLRNLLLDMSQSPSFAWAADIAGDIGQYRMLIFGLAMVAMMVLRPRGLMGMRTPSVLRGPKGRA